MNSHPIVHIEIPVNDSGEASKFYKEVFGWKLQTDATFDYTMFQSEGGPGGGFTKIDGQHTKPGDVLIYIGTEDIEASLSQVEQHGGKIVQPMTEIPNTGWFAIFNDPTGNRIALYKALRSGYTG